ncbi:MAG: divalent-cation tolerance protein CutA [Rivularia sp. ALOHA_DT_140]|nr:divalent-cation tolerance protein CutA [Rivularia sp. ALOHA_DT_140]
MDSTDYGIVLVTTGSQEEAEKIAHVLVEAKLAACVSFYAINSIYTWQGKVNKDQEWQLFIKTDLTRFPTLEAKIIELHSYEVPEIIALPILKGHQPYLQWISQQVN